MVTDKTSGVRAAGPRTKTNLDSSRAIHRVSTDQKGSASFPVGITLLDSPLTRDQMYVGGRELRGREVYN